MYRYRPFPLVPRNLEGRAILFLPNLSSSHLYFFLFHRRSRLFCLFDAFLFATSSFDVLVCEIRSRHACAKSNSSRMDRSAAKPIERSFQMSVSSSFIGVKTPALVPVCPPRNASSADSTTRGLRGIRQDLPCVLTHSIPLLALGRCVDALGDPAAPNRSSSVGASGIASSRPSESSPTLGRNGRVGLLSDESAPLFLSSLVEPFKDGRSCALSGF